jgi:hypothetical protein
MFYLGNSKTCFGRISYAGAGLQHYSNCGDGAVQKVLFMAALFVVYVGF